MKPGDDLAAFLNRKQPNHHWLIEPLISTDSGRYGLVGGRPDIGKSNLLLNMGFCLATGTPFLGMKTRRVKVGYYSLELMEAELKPRLQKLLKAYPEPQPDMLHIDCWEPMPLSKHEEEFAAAVRGRDVVIVDPIKYMVSGNYIEPRRATDFASMMLRLMRQESFVAVMGIQVIKENPKYSLEPGDLFKLKGAGDYVESATFALLVEKSPRKHKPGGFGWDKSNPDAKTIHFAKQAEADRRLEPIDTIYDYENCKFDIVKP